LRNFAKYIEKPKDNEIKTKYLSIPHINDKSEEIAIKLKNLIRDFYPQVNLRVAFKSPAQLGDHFPFKYRVIDPSRQALVVYHVKCNECDEDYIGMSIRILNQRVFEHNNDPDSHVLKHQKIKGHKMDFDNIRILDKASNQLKLQYKEMLYIRKMNPSINMQMNSSLFSLINEKEKSSFTN
jgi:hypothetical protein